MVECPRERDRTFIHEFKFDRSDSVAGVAVRINQRVWHQSCEIVLGEVVLGTRIESREKSASMAIPIACFMWVTRASWTGIHSLQEHARYNYDLENPEGARP